MPATDRRTVYGFLFIALVLGLVVGTIATYRGAFTSSVPLRVQADRAGLTLAAGAPVKLRGVVVGRVGEVSHPGDSDQVEIALDIDEDQFGRIAEDVTAEIVPPTAFGAKYVQLNPGRSGAKAIEPGTTITADRVTVEVDEAFTHLTRVLTAARPVEVNAALSAVAGAVDQRGEVIGELITRTDDYLTSFNPYLTTLTRDIRTGRKVADTYAGVSPDLVALADSAGTTSQTLVDQQASLRAFTVSLTGADDQIDTLVKKSGRRLVSTMQVLAPVTGVVAKYSPELPCTILGLASANKLAEAAVGGTHPGVTTTTRVVPARDPYTYSKNLPRIGDTSGPACYGLPYVTPAEAELTPPVFDTGANPYSGPQPTATENTLTTLFGLLGGVSNLPGGQQ